MRWICTTLLVAGCDAWPRFANLPDGEVALPTDEAGATFLHVADESEVEGGFPDTPQEVTIATEAALGGVYEGLSWTGSVTWGQATHTCDSTVDNACDAFGCGESSGFGVTHSGDLDFFGFSHAGGPLCLAVSTDLETDEGCGPNADTSPQWEATLWAFDDDCVGGDWLNAGVVEWTEGTAPPPDAESFPEPLFLNGAGLFFGNVDEGDYAVLLAGICGSYAGSPEESACLTDLEGPAEDCVPYTFGVAQVPSLEACNAISNQLSTL